MSDDELLRLVLLTGEPVGDPRYAFKLLVAHCRVLKTLNEQAANRIAAQSEKLSRRAERRNTEGSP